MVAIRSALVHPDNPVPAKTQPVNAKANNSHGNGSQPHSQEIPVGDWDIHKADVPSNSKGDVHTISLFAGVGIVKGSTAEAEWQVHWACS